MAGNARFELSSASSEPSFSGNFSNGQRGNYMGPNLERAGSFREGIESRMFGSGIGMARMTGTLVGESLPLSQCLMLEPIIMGDQKYTRSGELRRVLGFSIGSTSEDNSFGVAHVKPSPPVAMEELKRFRSSVSDACIKARFRAKKLDEHLHKLNKYVESAMPKKQHRNELLANDRSAGSNLKMGNQVYRNPPDLTQKLEDRPKSLVLNKRVRTSVAETRADGRNNGLSRQPLVMAKDREMLKDSGPDPDLVEEKIHRLPAGGEGWDKKMKRKRSVGSVFSRSTDSDGEPKRAMHNKLGSEPGLQSYDTQSFRSGSLNGSGGTIKFEGNSLPASSIARATAKTEQEKAPISRDLTAGLNKDRFLAKGSNKLNNREDNHVASSNPLAKGKASRAPRTSSLVAANSSANIPRVPGTLESWEQPISLNKITSAGGPNNRKRSMPTGSSSPPMAKWVGQRPPKMSRTRRSNLMSPVPNHDDVLPSSEGCSPSDFGAKLTSPGTNSPILSRGVVNGAQQFKVKIENISSPARLSESEESGAGENRWKEKGVVGSEMEEKAVPPVHNSCSPGMLTKKNKLLMKEEMGEGMRKQGRSGRGSSFSRTSISPLREKLDNGATAKPLRSTRPVSDKNGSKSSRPLKKLSDRKGFSRLGHTSNSVSPDVTGESDDDREELLAAANLASNASYHACSNLFWKKTEPLFASVRLEDTCFLSQQLKHAEELHESLSQMFDSQNNVLGDTVHKEPSLLDIVSGEKNTLHNQRESKVSASVIGLADQLKDAGSIFGELDSEGSDRFTPLYQRVLSALIVEDEIEAFEENDVERDSLVHNARRDSPSDALLFMDAEPRKRNRMESESGSILEVQTPHYGGTNGFLGYNGSTTVSRSSSIQNFSTNDNLQQGYGLLSHSGVEELADLSENDLNGPQNLQSKCLSTDCQYEHMCMNDKLLLELQSVGLYPETVPDLDDRENEVISQEICQLRRGLYQQICEKKMFLDKLSKAVQDWRDVEERNPEQVAMDRLVELAYKKLLATRGSSAARLGVAKVSKQVALAFARRTLARCRKLEESGTSCFSEPALRDVIFGGPPRGNEAEPVTFVGQSITNNKHVESCNPQPDPRPSGSLFSSAESGSLDTSETFNHQSDQAFIKNGPISNRGKKKEVLLDDVVGATALRATLGSSLSGGAKGRRSDRERDKDLSARNAVAKAGRTSVVNSKGERKTKTKPKQKTAQLSMSGNGFVSKFSESSHPVYPAASGSAGLASNNGNKKGEDPHDLSRETKERLDFTNLPLNELDPMEELGVGSDLGGNADLSSWLMSFDDDGLQDHDSVGLEIPMDDLSELNMF